MISRITGSVAVIVSVAAGLGVSQATGARGAADRVSVFRVPDNGLQPQVAVDAAGGIHVVYFKGEPGAGDLFYVTLDGATGRFSAPIRVNTAPASAIATGTVRGAHVAAGRNGRVHVAWMGSGKAAPRAGGGATPMLYARLDDTGRQFEPERNLLQFAAGLDGGGTVAADGAGRVYVAWHAGGPDGTSEADRRVWVARSADDGRTFTRETAASETSLGACGCCGMRALARADGTLFMAYRSATDMVNRDTYLLSSRDAGRTFTADRIDPWNVGACQMSTYALGFGRGVLLTAWETAGDVRWLARDLASGTRSRTFAPAGSTGRRKHPSIAANERGEVLLAWAEGTGWNKGGELAWQLFAATGAPIGQPGRAPGVPTWSLGAAAARPDGGFVIVY